MRHTSIPPARRSFLPVLLLAVVALATGCGPSTPPGPTAEADPAPPAEAGAPPAQDDPAQAETAGTPPKLEVISQRLELPGKAGDPGLDVVRGYTRRFYEGDLEGLHALFSDELKQDIPLDKLREMRASVRDRLGEEVELIGEDSQTRDEYRGFARWARFSKLDGVIEIQWILRQDDTIAGFIIKQVDRKQSAATP